MHCRNVVSLTDYYQSREDSFLNIFPPGLFNHSKYRISIMAGSEDQHGFITVKHESKGK